MIITGAELRPLVLKLSQPFSTGHTIFYERYIWIIKVFIENEEFIGEISPLPEFNSENGTTINESFDLFSSLIPEKLELNTLEEITHLLKQFGTTPAFKSGLEQALLQAYTSTHQIHLTSLFNKESFLSTIPVNATVGILDTIKTLECIRELMEIGFRCFKMKVGRKYLDDDIRIINSVFDSFGDQIEIRLDANRCWKFGQAVTFFQGINHLPITYIEEPVTDFEQFRALRNYTHIPLAADESIHDIRTAKEVIKEGFADVLVVKPGVFGGIISSMDLIENAHEHNKRTTITSSLDTPLGKRKAVITAALIGHASPCGLDTVRFFLDNPFDDLYPVVNAQIYCGDLKL